MLDFDRYTEILKEELRPAMGCTEPIAIAYAASLLADALGCRPTALRACLSGNIIKNVKSVIVPATGGLHGIEAALAAGIVACAPQRQLEVLTVLGEADLTQINTVLKECSTTVEELPTDKPFEVKLYGKGPEGTAFVHLADRHTHILRVERNGTDLTDRYPAGNGWEREEDEDRNLLTVEDIIEYADRVPLDAIYDVIRQQIDMNMAIAYEGIENDYGAAIGRLLWGKGEGSVKDRARALAAAGSDARMSGCERPVCILSGSGNQGICASVPVVVYAEEIGASEEALMRALVVSDLITVHQKTGIGCLSAYCGAISAGCGCACGICYLFGGRYHEVAHTLVNSLAILSGTICDGAKPSCAAKIAMAVEAGLMGYGMTCAGKEFLGGDGIVTKGVENTIRNVGRLARQGMSETDREIIRMML